MRRQCAKCPWRKGVAPFDIPGGYEPALHAALADTIAEPGALILGGGAKVMACHETPIGSEQACVGWLVHQLGPGNNLRLRLMVHSGEIDADVETVGEQHETFADTLPKAAKKPRKPLRPRRS